MRHYRLGIVAALSALVFTHPIAAQPERSGWDQRAPTSAMVFFNFNSLAITPAGQSALNSIATIHATKPNAKVRVIGILNGSGQERSRQAIAQRRADTVKARLVSLGISSDLIVTSLEPPRLPTFGGPGERRPSQRRVEIYVE